MKKLTKLILIPTIIVILVISLIFTVEFVGDVEYGIMAWLIVVAFFLFIIVQIGRVSEEVKNENKIIQYQFKQQVVSSERWNEDEEKKMSIVKIPNTAVHITINEQTPTEDLHGYAIVQWLEPVKEMN